jgi:glutamine amidotransferase
MTKMLIDIIDYGMGNVQSVRNAFELLGCEVRLSGDPERIKDADALVLPGVGAFGEAMSNLRQRRLIEPLRDAVLNDGKPLLGICLGMQLLADESDEHGTHKGLSLIPGHVRSIPVPKGFMIPHIGWNGVRLAQPAPLFRHLQDGDAFYFVHSHRFEGEAEHVVATTNHGVDITASIRKDRLFAVQFHPERSQRKGLQVLRNFVSYVESLLPEDRRLG